MTGMGRPRAPRPGDRWVWWGLLALLLLGYASGDLWR